MLFNSFQFLLFFPIVVLIYYNIPHKYRWGFLLFSSCFFYMFFIPYYILILLLTITVDYSAAIFIEKSSGRKKIFLLVISILSTCLILAFFKYFYFLVDTVSILSSYFHFSFSKPLLNIILPIGLSFHTFQSLSYVIEVYRGGQKAEKHFGIYSLYVMFFPQLVAGPIERPQNLLCQFHAKHNFNYTTTVSGLKLIAWGLFKKVVVADRLSVYVNFVYSDPSHHTGFPLIFATIFFAFQIFADFSGYSDIARGCARILGFELMVNFKDPYFSKSISEFWKRWHISLSTWFKDYVYIPLGGNRVPLYRNCTNLLITFGISGLWHGAGWHFIIWGLLNGFFLCGEIIIKNVTQRITHFFKMSINSSKITFVFKTTKIITTFCIICTAWVFFRAESTKDACFILFNLCSDISIHSFKAAFNVENNGLGVSQTMLAIFNILLLLSISYLHNKINIHKLLGSLEAWQRHCVYYCILIFILIFGYFQDKTPFIYFQF